MTAKLADHLRALPDDGLGALATDCAPIWSCRCRPTSPRWPRGRRAGSRWRGRWTAWTSSRSRCSTACAWSADETRRRVDRDAARAGRPRPGPSRRSPDRGGPAAGAVPGLRPDDTTVQLVGAIDELSTPYPAGLGRPAAELAELTKRRNRPGRAAAPTRPGCAGPCSARRPRPGRCSTGWPPARPIGTAALRTRRRPESPVRLAGRARACWSRIADDLVELPREVGTGAAPGHRSAGRLHPAPPEVAGSGPGRRPTRPGPGRRWRPCATSTPCCRRSSPSRPPPVLRSCGLGVRDLRRLARTPASTRRSGRAAARDRVRGRAADPHRDADAERRPAVAAGTAPTTRWRTAPLAQRWAVLARTWLAMTRAPALVGQRDDRDRPISALSARSTRSSAPQHPAGRPARCWPTCRRAPPPTRGRGARAACVAGAAPVADTAPAAAVGPARAGPGRADRGGRARRDRAGRAHLVRAAAARRADRDADEDPLGDPADDRAGRG